MWSTCAQRTLLDLAYLTYVLWAITPEGRPRNLGELLVHDGKSSVQTTTDLQAFALVVTAEPYFAVTQPSDLVVAQNVIRHDTKGGVEPVDVKFELISRDTYNSQVQPINSPVYEVSNKTPLDLLEARNAVRIAKDAGAGQYAASELQKAQDLLNQAEDYYRRKQGGGPIGTVAREATQTAEEARVMSIKREQDGASSNRNVKLLQTRRHRLRLMRRHSRLRPLKLRHKRSNLKRKRRRQTKPVSKPS